MDLGQTRLDLSNAREALMKARKAKPYSIHAEIEAQQKVEAYEKGLELGEKILAERF